MTMRFRLARSGLDACYNLSMRSRGRIVSGTLRCRGLRRLVAAGAVLATVVACTSAPPPGGSDGAPSRPPSTSAPAATSPASSESTPPGPPAVLTPGGMWWGFDSSGPISAAALANVHGWYRGARPQFWGRYVSGDYGVSRAELAFARKQGIYVYLLVNDPNCSQCAGGGDVCGNDTTAAQARLDARAAIRAATGAGVGRGALLFKDIEQVSSCRGEPTPDYLNTWYRTLKHTDYVTGFYANAYQQNYDFPRG